MGLDKKIDKTEAREQSEVFQHFWNNFPQYRRLLFHIPNGGKRHGLEAMKFKAMGVVAGVPDLFFALARSGYHGLFIEMKKGGKRVNIDSDQHKCKEAFEDQNYLVKEFDNSEEAIKFIETYIKAR